MYGVCFMCAVGVGCMVRDVWFMLYWSDVLCVMSDVRCMMYGVPRMMYDVWRMVFGVR